MALEHFIVTDKKKCFLTAVTLNWSRNFGTEERRGPKGRWNLSIHQGHGDSWGKRVPEVLHRLEHFRDGIFMRREKANLTACWYNTFAR